jgi:thiol-disulfide isomerase/thioredoxin
MKMRFSQVLSICAVLIFNIANAAAEPDAEREQPSTFEFEPSTTSTMPPPVEKVPDFESRGLKVTYRTADGKEISKAEFEAQVKEQEVSMRVDGGNKTVEFTIGGKLPAELQVPLGIEPGAPMPSLALVDSRGKRHGWPRTDGKFTLLNFYFSGCGPCIQEIPEINAFAAQRQDIAVLAITFDSKEETHRFAEERKLAWDIVPDARDYINELKVTVYPTLLLVDPSGRLVAKRDVVPSEGAGAHESLDRWVSRTIALARR